LTLFYSVHSQSRTVHQIQNSSNNVNKLASTTLSSAKWSLVEKTRLL
jgi:hypothetical protein